MCVNSHCVNKGGCANDEVLFLAAGNDVVDYHAGHFGPYAMGRFTLLVQCGYLRVVARTWLCGRIAYSVH